MGTLIPLPVRALMLDETVNRQHLAQSWNLVRDGNIVLAMS